MTFRAFVGITAALDEDGAVFRAAEGGAGHGAVEEEVVLVFLALTVVEVDVVASSRAVVVAVLLEEGRAEGGVVLRVEGGARATMSLVGDGGEGGFVELGEVEREEGASDGCGFRDEGSLGDEEELLKLVGREGGIWGPVGHERSGVRSFKEPAGAAVLISGFGSGKDGEVIGTMFSEKASRVGTEGSLGVEATADLTERFSWEGLLSGERGGSLGGTGFVGLSSWKSWRASMALSRKLKGIQVA